MIFDPSAIRQFRCRLGCHAWALVSVMALMVTITMLEAEAAQTAASGVAPAAGGNVFMRFPAVRLGLSDKPPTACAPDSYGVVTARSPDGALCLCHAGFGGKEGFWEQQGTGQPCWPDKK